MDADIAVSRAATLHVFLADQVPLRPRPMLARRAYSLFPLPPAMGRIGQDSLWRRGREVGPGPGGGECECVLRAGFASIWEIGGFVPLSAVRRVVIL
jgi:hypothetical protein